MIVRPPTRECRCAPLRRGHVPVRIILCGLIAPRPLAMITPDLQLGRLRPIRGQDSRAILKYPDGSGREDLGVAASPIPSVGMQRVKRLQAELKKVWVGNGWVSRIPCSPQRIPGIGWV